MNDFAKMFDPQQFAQSFDMKNFDFSKMMNMNAFKDMPKWWPDMKATNVNLNGIDMQQIAEANKKNFEAVTQANQMALAGMQNIMRRQADIFRETMEVAGKLMTDAMAAGTPEEKLSRQAGLAKTAFETATKNMQELAEMVSTSQSECLKVINERVTQSLGDLQTTGKAA